MQKDFKLDTTQYKNLKFLVFFVICLVFLLVLQVVWTEQPSVHEDMTCEKNTIDQEIFLNNG
ncbi:MAG: hypothetical protein NW226_24190 [Microscillaceae bacterium]|nr:hypothetical protein [Microscillaceae bacterium]